MAKNLTPAYLRCGVGISCPSVHELEDGRLLIVGEAAALSTVGREAVRELRDAGKIADTEFAIAIDRELLSGLDSALRTGEEGKSGVDVAEEAKGGSPANVAGSRGMGNEGSMTTTPDFEAQARETWLKIYETSMVMVHPDDVSRYVSIISSALLRAFELGCQAGHSAACEPSSSLRSSSSENGAEAWQPIETAPKDGTEILIRGTAYSMLRRKSITAVARWSRGWWGNYQGAPCYTKVTHWMPLPQPPLPSDEEAGTADEVSAANTSASLTPHQEEA